MHARIGNRGSPILQDPQEDDAMDAAASFATLPPSTGAREITKSEQKHMLSEASRRQPQEDGTVQNNYETTTVHSGCSINK